MTQAVQASPALPVPPVAPAPEAGRVISQTAPGSNVYTASDIGALKARREELSRQLNSADGRRRALHEQLRRADGADRVGLEQRLAGLDGRIAGLEADIADNGRKLASPEALRVTASPPWAWTPASGNRIADNGVPIAMMFILFVLTPIAASISRILWRRGSLRPAPERAGGGAERLERIEQAIDAIAIEVERVSEGQRFVTRLLSEARPAVAAGGAQQGMEPLRVGPREGAANPR